MTKLEQLVNKALDLYKADSMTDYDRIGFVLDIYLSSLAETTVAGKSVDNLMSTLAAIAPKIPSDALVHLAGSMLETALAIKYQKHMLVLDVSIIQAIIESRKATEDGGNVTEPSSSETTPNSNDTEGNSEPLPDFNVPFEDALKVADLPTTE